MKEDRVVERGADEEPFLSRWSKRKLAQEESGPDASTNQELAAELSTEAPRDLTDADMPPIESLDETSDYSGFLSPKVSEALRQQALQKLFRSADFNVCDGLDDYAEDFTRFEKLGELITSELRFRLQQEAERAKEKVEAEVSSADEIPSTHLSSAGQERLDEGPEEGDSRHSQNGETNRERTS